MAQDLAYSYASILKSEKQEDGTLKVYGKATDDSIDIDQQICDDSWLQKAMPDWFTTGGNIREQHSNIAAGVATEYEAKSDGHYITALVVDRDSVKKVEAGVLKGFSIGIRGPRVVRDAKAAGGRIIDGQIIEISLVDRPANPNAKLMLAKAADGGVLEAVKQLSIPSPADLVKYSEDQERDAGGRFGSGGGSSSESSSNSNSSSSGNVFKDTDKTIMGHADALMEHAMSDKNAYEAVARLGDAQSALNAAEAAPSDASASTPSGLSNEAAGALMQSAGSMLMAASAASSSSNPAVKAEGEKIRNSWEKLMPMVNRLTTGKSADADVAKNDDTTATLEEPTEGTTMPEETVVTEEVAVDAPAEETATEEVVTEDAPAEETVAEETTDEAPAEVEIIEAAKSLIGTLNKFDAAKYESAVNAIADLIVVEAEEMKVGHDERDSIKQLLRAAKHLARWYEGEVEEGEVPDALPVAEDIYLSAEGDSEDCGCDGGEGCECADDKMCKCNMAAKSASVTVDDEQISAIITKAVDSAKAAVTDEIESLKTALEAESAKAIQLTEELAVAKKAAVAGGPKRSTISKSVQDVNELLIKATEYRVKAANTGDKDLAEGYRELAADLEAKTRKDNA